MNLMKSATAAAIAALFLLAPVMASAHSTNFAYRDVGDGTVDLYLGTYHVPSQFSTSIGVIIDGVEYNFTGTVASLPTDAQPNETGFCDSRAASFGIGMWMTVNIPTFGPGSFSVAPTAHTFVETPWNSTCWPKTVEFDLAPAEGRLFSVSRDDGNVREIDTGTAATLSSVAITLSGSTIFGGLGLATDPTTGTLWAILKTSNRRGGRVLATLSPTTGVAASVGNLAGGFAGIAFDASGTLYAVTGDGGGGLQPESLYTLNKSTGAATFVRNFGRGNDGETIGFNPDDGKLYHASGHTGSGVIFESMDLGTLVLTDIPIGAPLTNEEAQAITYSPAQQGFFWKQGHFANAPLYLVSPITGAAVLIGNMNHTAKGLAFNGAFVPTNADPVASCKDTSVSADAACQGTVTAADVDDGSTDSDGTIVSLALSPAGPYALDDTDVTLTVTDDDSATNTCLATVTVVDDTDPTITAPAGATVRTDAGACSATGVTLVAATADDNCSVAIGDDAPGTYNLGATVVTFTATDGSGNTATDTATVSVEDNEDPSVSAPADAVLDADAATCTATASYAASTGDNCSVASESNDAPAGGVYPLGDTTVTFSATDGSGNSDSDSMLVTVQDVTAPSIDAVSASPAVLWPPNHKMVSVTLSATTSDACDASVVCEITGATSNEADNGTGDGNTTGDVGDHSGMSIDLRAERAGGGSGRTYTVAFVCTDGASNSSTGTTTVTVPHSQGGGGNPQTANANGNNGVRDLGQGKGKGKGK